MDQRRKGRIELYHDVPTLKTNGTCHLIPINLNAYKCAIDQAYLDFLAAQFPRQLFFGPRFGTLLYESNNPLHLSKVEWFVGVFARHAHRSSCALYQFARNADYSSSYAHLCLLLGLT